MRPLDMRQRLLRQQADEVATLIEEMQRTLRTLESEIAFEEKKASITDAHHPQYPNIALEAASRCEKLRASIKFLLTLHDRQSGNMISP